MLMSRKNILLFLPLMLGIIGTIILVPWGKSYVGNLSQPDYTVFYAVLLFTIGYLFFLTVYFSDNLLHLFKKHS